MMSPMNIAIWVYSVFSDRPTNVDVCIWINLIMTLRRDVAGMMFYMGNPPQWPYFNYFQVSELFQFRQMGSKLWMTRLVSKNLYLVAGFASCLMFFSLDSSDDDPNWRAYFGDGLKPPIRLGQIRLGIMDRHTNPMLLNGKQPWATSNFKAFGMYYPVWLLGSSISAVLDTSQYFFAMPTIWGWFDGPRNWPVIAKVGDTIVYKNNVLQNNDIWHDIGVLKAFFWSLRAWTLNVNPRDYSTTLFANLVSPDGEYKPYHSTKHTCGKKNVVYRAENDL